MMRYDDFLELLKCRRSIRKFKPDPIPEEDITKILDAAHYAMSGGNSQPWEFIVVKNPEMRKKLLDAYFNYHQQVWHLEQMRIPQYRHPAFNVPLEEKNKAAAMLGGWGDAPVVIAVLQDPRKQLGSVLSAFLPPVDVLSASMAHCTAIIHLAAASLGLGSQRVDIQNQQPFREILGYPEPLSLIILVPVGYMAYEPGPPDRLPLEELVHFERYDMERIRKLGRPGYRAVIGEEKG
jgi:nitroreductase